MSETYDGPALIGADGREFPVRVRLSARFEPVEGRYRWAGRATPDEDLTALFRAGVRDVRVRTGAAPGDRPARLSEPDPWGGLRVSGAGAPPWDLTDPADPGSYR